MLLSLTNCLVFMIITIFYMFTYSTTTRNFLTYVSKVFRSSNIIATIFVSTVCGEHVQLEVWMFKWWSLQKFYLYMAVVLQAHKTSHVHSSLNRTSSHELYRKLMQFLQQLLHRQPKFSCGLFAFDAELAFKARSDKLL